ncbi:hypothetical protein Fmac_006063 [Flemingia macrophylla]|uniref:Uncharacterized protein n=1 Tax=Flemingia macrophylla TaxID=520843 RepID=A0ABD1NAZ6_9FABA
MKAKPQWFRLKTRTLELIENKRSDTVSKLFTRTTEFNLLSLVLTSSTVKSINSWNPLAQPLQITHRCRQLCHVPNSVLQPPDPIVQRLERRRHLESQQDPQRGVLVVDVAEDHVTVLARLVRLWWITDGEADSAKCVTLAWKANSASTTSSRASPSLLGCEFYFIKLLQARWVEYIFIELSQAH